MNVKHHNNSYACVRRASFDHCGHLLQRSRVREHQEYGLVPVYTFSTTPAMWSTAGVTGWCCDQGKDGK